MEKKFSYLNLDIDVVRKILAKMELEGMTSLEIEVEANDYADSIRINEFTSVDDGEEYVDTIAEINYKKEIMLDK